MDNKYTSMAAERKSWIEHTLVYNDSIRKANLSQIDNFVDEQNLYLSYTESSWEGFTYTHWFVTDKTFYLEFGAPSMDIYSARVTVNANLHNSYPLNDNMVIKMSREVRDRMRNVLGMCNYSLCLRNCEHVANFVFTGHWYSSQMDEGGWIMSKFKSQILGYDLPIVNAFPSKIKPHQFVDDSVDDHVYSFMECTYKAERFDYFLDGTP